MTFEGFDEAEGAWIDDSDEWEWIPTPRTGVPTALPVAGAWRVGLYAGAIEKIYMCKGHDEESSGAHFLIKWKGLVRPPAPPAQPLALAYNHLSAAAASAAVAASPSRSRPAAPMTAAASRSGVGHFRAPSGRRSLWCIDIAH